MIQLPSNMSNSWYFNTFMTLLTSKYPELDGMLTEHAPRLADGFDPNAQPRTLAEFLWSRCQAYLGKERGPGWHRRVVAGYPDDAANCILIGFQIRQEAGELWTVGADRKSGEIIRVSEAMRALSVFVYAMADKHSARMQQGLQHFIAVFPQLDYEVARQLPHWNSYTQLVTTQALRQDRVFKNTEILPLDDEED